MSEQDPRFSHPIEFVKKHVLGCFEASKACAILPGKPHLYHAEFLKRPDHHIEELGAHMPLDCYTEVHYSPCEEVSWYLHTKEGEQDWYEGSVTPDPQFIAENAQGNVPDRRARIRLQDLLPETSFTHTLADPMTDEEKKSWIKEAVEAHANKLAQTAAQLSVPSAPTTPENFKESETVTIPKVSRYDRIKRELQDKTCRHEWEDGNELCLKCGQHVGF